jgi:hypothetical protein
MSEEEKPWYEQLKEAMSENPEAAKRISQVIPGGTTHNWCNGKVANLERINPGYRAVIYKELGLELMKPEGYIDPDKINVEKIISGEERTQLDIYLGSKTMNRGKFAKANGVHEDTVRRYFKGKKISPQLEEKIVKGLRKMSKSADGGAEKKVVEASEEPRYSGCESDLQKLAESVDGLAREVRRIGGNYTPTLDERREIVAGMIDTFVEQMDYYASATKEFKKGLIDFLREEGEIPRYGWADNVFRGLLEGDHAPEVFARDLTPKSRKGKN